VPASPERHIQVPVPAIVDEALFAAAAEQLEENRRRNRERLAGLQYLLRGLLVCQKCGYCFTGYNPRPRRYYGAVAEVVESGGGVASGLSNEP
jgi:site-specific DNA recombinase